MQLIVRDVVAHEELPGAADLVDELFADAERILARGDYEGIGDAESFHTKLAGVTFEGRQEVVARLSEGTALRLVRQPDNPFDPNAIALFDATGDQVGFFNRALAAALAPEIDAGAVYDVSVTDVTGREARDEGAARSLGVNVLVERAGAGPREAERRRDRAARAGRSSRRSRPPELDAELVRALIGDGRLHARPASKRSHTSQRAARASRSWPPGAGSRSSSTCTRRASLSRAARRACSSTRCARSSPTRRSISTRRSASSACPRRCSRARRRSRSGTSRLRGARRRRGRRRC